MKVGKKIKTKDRIIETAIEMFNEQGIRNITSRHIAAEMNISNGNLDYHYRNKEALLVAIHKKMRKEMSENYSARDEHDSPFAYFDNLLDHIERFQYKYKFFCLDVLELTRSYPEVSESLNSTLLLRIKQMSEIFDEFVEDGLLVENDKTIYTRVEHKIRILTTFWLSQEVVLSQYSRPKLGDMRHYIWELLVPYMTPKGLNEYRELQVLQEA